MIRTRLTRLLKEYAIYIATHCLGGTRSLLGDFRRPKLPGVLDNKLGTRLNTKISAGLAATNWGRPYQVDLQGDAAFRSDPSQFLRM